MIYTQTNTHIGQSRRKSYRVILYWLGRDAGRRPAKKIFWRVFGICSEIGRMEERMDG